MNAPSTVLLLHSSESDPRVWASFVPWLEHRGVSVATPDLGYRTRLGARVWADSAFGMADQQTNRATFDLCLCAGDAAAVGVRLGHLGRIAAVVAVDPNPGASELPDQVDLDAEGADGFGEWLEAFAQATGPIAEAHGEALRTGNLSQPTIENVVDALMAPDRPRLAAIDADAVRATSISAFSALYADLVASSAEPQPTGWTELVQELTCPIVLASSEHTPTFVRRALRDIAARSVRGQQADLAAPTAYPWLTDPAELIALAG